MNQAAHAQTDHSNTKWRIAIAVMMLLIILLLSFKACSTGYVDNIFDDPIPMAQGEDYQKMLDDAVADSMMNVNYQPYVTFEGDGIHSRDFEVNNSPNNHDSMKFHIYDEDMNKIYESADIPTGYQVANVTLWRALSPGEHDCTIELHYSGSDSIKSRFPLHVTVMS